MIKRLLSIFMAACFLGCPGFAFAGETDLLIQKLVEKGILTPYEAQIMQDDIKQEVNKQNAKGANEMIPAWIQTVKLKGDVRLRYQTQQKEAGTVQNRGRVRMRLGLEAKPSEQFLVGAGLATGSDADTRSTNETLGDGFQKDGIYLDYAWAEYKPLHWMSVIGGKYNALGKNYLWYTTDMLWDSDINQEGASAHFDFAKVLGGDVFLNAGYWALSENSTHAADAGMFYGQAGVAYNLSEPLALKVAGTYYGNQFNDCSNALGGGVCSGSGSGVINNGKTGDNFDATYDYNTVYAASAELVYSLPAETSSPIKMVGVFGDYSKNPDPATDETGWAAGLKFGHPKVGAARGDWQFKYQYVHLESNAWVNIFPDSDRRDGKTNTEGHEFVLDIGLAKNVSLGLDYYRSDLITGVAVNEHIFQADLNFKF